MNSSKQRIVRQNNPCFPVLIRFRFIQVDGWTMTSTMKNLRQDISIHLSIDGYKVSMTCPDLPRQCFQCKSYSNLSNECPERSVASGDGPGAPSTARGSIKRGKHEAPYQPSFHAIRSLPQHCLRNGDFFLSQSAGKQKNTETCKIWKTQ